MLLGLALVVDDFHLLDVSGDHVEGLVTHTDDDGGAIVALRVAMVAGLARIGPRLHGEHIVLLWVIRFDRRHLLAKLATHETI